MEELVPEEVAVNAVRWIDASCIFADCLTKRMNPVVMIDAMRKGILYSKATAESKLLEMCKKELRATTKENAQLPNAIAVAAMIGRCMRFRG